MDSSAFSERESQGTIKGRTRKKYTKEDTENLVEDPIINELNAISHGVEQRIDHIIGSSKIVTEKTTQIARQLEIPEAKIRLWEKRRTGAGLNKKTTAYNSRNEEEQRSITYALMNAIKLLVDKD